MTLEAGSTLPLSSLLPYDCKVNQSNKNASTFLNEYKLLTTLLSDALTAFQAGELEKFDSLVGENACHIRALKIAELASINLATADRTAEIAAIQAKIGILVPSLKKATFQELLTSHHLDIHLSKDEMFLVQAYLLTLTKQVVDSKNICSSEVSNPTNLTKLGDVTNSFAKKLEHQTRHLLAESSTQYIKDCASTTNNPILIAATSEKFTLNHKNYLPCTPLFWTFQTILHTLSTKKIPLVFHAKFLAKDQGNAQIDDQYLTYDFTDSKLIPTQPAPQKPVFVIEGVVQANADELPSPAQWIEAFQKVPTLDVILSNVAAHRQYPDQEADSKLLDLQDKQFSHYKAEATRGFSLENPSLFFITHVFASRTDHLPI